ncbi:MAG: crotonase/enoyl-CoA hydratase family protein [Desulfobacteraceae bacterium]|nr:crotonase/enoyl-CoA hydratase family protein [Desulfobacteraceae bacterium]
MGTAKIHVEKNGHVLMIAVNRPEKRNAFSVEMYCDLASAYGELNYDANLRCGLLFAEGEHFTAGLDLNEWAPLFSSGRFPHIPDDAIDPFGLNTDKKLCKPVVMATQGVCLTIGLELMLATDIRVAATNTRFGQIEIKRGIYPVGGGTIRLMQEIGWGNAMRYLLTGDLFSAHDAYRVGLVQELTEPGKQLETALAIARTISKQSPLGVQATLKSAKLAREQGEDAAFARLMPDLVPIMSSDDFKEGIQSFLERRDAVFTGK